MTNEKTVCTIQGSKLDVLRWNHVLKLLV